MTMQPALEDHVGRRPNWEFIRVDVQMPEHPKVEGLSDKAFRVLVELWCYCGRQHSDGLVTARQWRAVPARVRAELVMAGLAEETGAGPAVMHDYTAHNRSRGEIDELSRKRAEAGRKGGSRGRRLLAGREKHLLRHLLRRLLKHLLSTCQARCF